MIFSFAFIFKKGGDVGTLLVKNYIANDPILVLSSSVRVSLHKKINLDCGSRMTISV